MASLGTAFGATLAGRRRMLTPKATSKGTGAVEEENGLLDWILGGLAKKDQLLETDPLLKKVEDKTASSGRSTTSVSIPNKKKFGGLGGLFAKN